MPCQSTGKTDNSAAHAKGGDAARVRRRVRHTALAHIIPNTSFSSKSQRRDFITLVKSKIRAAAA
jgi:hypothetical protein